MQKKNKEVGIRAWSEGDQGKDAQLYAITRLKAADNAWLWRVEFRRRGRLHFKSFYDLKLGGSDHALQAAKAWRDRMLAKAKVFTHREFHMQRRSNNTSGVSGVHFLRTDRQPVGAWQAKIKLPNGRAISKSFSIRRFGRRAAYRLAVAARTEMLKLVDQQPYLYDETAKRFAARQAKAAKRA